MIKLGGKTLNLQQISKSAASKCPLICHSRLHTATSSALLPKNVAVTKCCMSRLLPQSPHLDCRCKEFDFMMSEQHMKREHML